MEGRPNCRDKAAFLNFRGVLWTLLETGSVWQTEKYFNNKIGGESFQMKMKFYQSCCSELLCALLGYIFDLRVLSRTVYPFSFKFGISVHDAKYFSIKKFNKNNDHV